MLIEGYRTCPCGAQVLDITASLTGGRCMECFIADDYSPLREIEIAVRGGKTTMKMPGRRDHGPNKGRPETRRKVEKARTRAMRRLRHLYPDVFDVLYAEERHRVGLAPVPHREAGHLVNAVATYQPPETYDAAVHTPPES